MSSSPFVRDVPAAEALAAWREACRRDGCPDRVPSHSVPVAEAAGGVTAAPIWAHRSSPSFDAAAMDGIAVSAARTIGATPTTPLRLSPGDFEVVDTGDPLPPDRDAVIMREHVHHLDTPDGQQAEIHAAVPPYQHVRSIGEDVATGELLLPVGHRLRPVDLAAAAAAGNLDVEVRRSPKVTVIPTGDEIRPLGSEPQGDQIVDTNSLMLVAQAREVGCDAAATDIVPDDPQAIATAVREAASTSDLVIVIAGSSAGRDDHTADVIAEVGTVAVHGVAVRPGHPVVLGTVDATPVVGAPGYPVSAALTFDIFVAPLLAELEGTTPTTRPRVTARLARKLASVVGMDDWVRVRLGQVDERIVATPLPRGAGVLTSLVRADGLLVVPDGVEGYGAGEDVEVALTRDLDDIRRTIVAIGSHDLVLDLAASTLRARDPRVTLASSNVGSLGGLVALRDGLCHLAGSHLLDPDTGVYTLPYLERTLPDHDLTVVRLVHRQQCLMVAPGNPLGIEGIDDLRRDGLRYVNRQRGAGTRVLLDHELRRRGISPEQIDGYTREEHTHLGVAAAVAAGRADTGLGIVAAARALDLDVVWVADEPYDLVVNTQAWNEDRRLEPFRALLDDPGFRAAVDAIGGYDTTEMGLIVSQTPTGKEAG
jgi:putative molybdopterin biosynthesis protein